MPKTSLKNSQLNSSDNKFSGRYKLIFNPNAGAKRSFFGNKKSKNLTLEEIKHLLNQYQIPVDYYPTKGPGHATELAMNAVNEGYKMVIVAGGDGTVGETANGLIGTDVTLAILPLGSFMNIAKMLSIPFELEKAILLIKIGKVRKIDVGSITEIGGQKLDAPHYFIESVGIGLEAQLQNHLLQMERGNFKVLIDLYKTLFDYYGHKAVIKMDDIIHETRATLVTFSNGPFAGANLPLAPQAKLNDHRITIRFFKMKKRELGVYFFNTLFGSNSWLSKKLQIKRRLAPKIETYQAKKVTVQTRTQRLVHGDARFFGTTPISMEIYPNALNVLTGFSPDGEVSSFNKRTYLEP